MLWTMQFNLVEVPLRTHVWVLPGTHPLPRMGPAHTCLPGLGTLLTLGFLGVSETTNLGKGYRQKSVETQESHF